MMPPSPCRTIDKNLAFALFAVLATAALTASSDLARGEGGGEEAAVGALVQFVEVAPTAEQQQAEPERLAPVVNAAHLERRPERLRRTVYRITSDPIDKAPAEGLASGPVRVRISSKELEELSMAADAAARLKPTATTRLSDRTEDGEEALVGLESRVYVEDQEIPLAAPPVENSAEGESSPDEKQHQDSLQDYRLASKTPSVVLLVEGSVLDVLQSDAEDGENGSETSREPAGDQETASDSSLIVLAQPPRAGGLESIASMSVDRKLLEEQGLRPIGQVGADIRPKVGELPTDYAAPLFARVGQIRQGTGATRDWGMYAFNWEAKGLCYGPLRFEEVNLERHGYAVPLVQPVLSAAHFFGTLPILPYKMAATSRWNCQYSLGHYRPGSYTPFRYNRVPWRLYPAAVQAGVVTGAVLVLP